MSTTITSTANYIKAEFNGDSTDTTICYKRLSTIQSLSLHTGRRGTYVELIFDGGDTWSFDTTGTRGYVVGGGVNAGGTPSDNEALLTQLAALIIT